MENVLYKAKSKEENLVADCVNGVSFYVNLNYTNLKYFNSNINKSSFYINLIYVYISIKNNKESHNFKGVDQTGFKPCLFSCPMVPPCPTFALTGNICHPLVHYSLHDR